MSDDNATALSELIQFLAPTTRLDVRRNALSLVASLGSNIDGSAGELFMQNDSALGKVRVSDLKKMKLVENLDTSIRRQSRGYDHNISFHEISRFPQKYLMN